MDNVGRVGNAECAAAVIALLVMRVLRPQKMISQILLVHTVAVSVAIVIWN